MAGMTGCNPKIARPRVCGDHALVPCAELGPVTCCGAQSRDIAVANFFRSLMASRGSMPGGC